MPVNTYYFDGSDGVQDPDNVWENEPNAYDGNESTYAEYGGLYVASESSYYLHIQGTNAPSSGNNITQVRARLKGFSSQGMQAIIYTDGLGQTLGTTPLTYSDWSSYTTLTTPTGGWTWAKVQDLEARLIGGEYDNNNGVYQVEVEVTDEAQGLAWLRA